MNIPYAFKRCGTCGEWKVANNYNFMKSKKYKWNLHYKCKKCVKEYSKKNKDKKRKYDKEYYKKNKEHKLKLFKEYKEKNKEQLREYHKQYNKQYHKNNPEKIFNNHNKHRSKLENQGRGINEEQWRECFKWFDWKCAYSGEKLKHSKNTYGRTIDHILALNNGGLNEPWNIIPMRKGYNSGKCNRTDSMTWYIEQKYFDIERLERIVEWQIYAYEKWGGEEFGELILITDLIED